MDRGPIQLRAIRESLHGQLGGVSRDIASRSLPFFCRRYLPAHFKHAPSSMHLEIFETLERAAAQRGARLALAAPRGHAKSTIVSLAFLLWVICFLRERYIVLISDTGDQARDHLANLKRELEDNAILARDFPEAAGPSASPPWRKEEILTRNGVKVVALGAGSKIRGRRHGQHRPGLIVLDDGENEEMVRFEGQRLSLAEWFRSAVMQAGVGSTNVIVVGTVLHPDSLLATLTDPTRSPGWTGRRYRAVLEWAERGELWERWRSIYCGLDEHEGRTGPDAALAFFESRREEMLRGSSVLWPEVEDYYALMVTRLREGPRAFATEKQNEPLSPDDALFQERDLHFWDKEFPTQQAFDAFAGECLAFGACDPSLGKAGRGRDDTAIVTVLRHRVTGVLYVAHADIRKRKPDNIIDAIIELHRKFNYMRFGFEAVQFQEVVAGLLVERSRAAGLEVPVVPIQQTTDKITRLQRVQPLIASGGVRLSRRHTTLVDQLLQFPHGAHDDGPDALEMAVQVSQERRRAWRWLDPVTGQITDD